MLKQALCGLSTALLLCGECVPGPETRYGRVEVFATDRAGQRLRDVEIELVPAGAETGAVPTTTKAATTRVLYGDYRLRVAASGFRATRRDLGIFQPETLVQVELAVSEIGCPPPPADIGGRVKREGGTGELWVKAVPVRGIGGGEARVGDSGYFLISGLEYSAYLVMVIQGETVLHQQVVKTDPAGSGSQRLVIVLTARR